MSYKTMQEEFAASMKSEPLNSDPAKVVVEITGEGYKTILFDYKDRVITKQEFIMNGPCDSHGTEKAEISDKQLSNYPENFRYAFNDFGMSAFEMARQLIFLKR